MIHFPRRFAGALAILVALCTLASFSVFTPTKSNAATPYREPAKDTMQILPSKLQSNLRVPAHTISIYESTTNAVVLQSQGCKAAHQAPGLIILDWGQPMYLGNNVYGTYDFGRHYDTDTAILHAVANFAQGIWNCRIDSTDIALGIGESNYFSDRAIPLTTAAWYADGQQWGRMVNNLQSFLNANHYNHVVGANGAGDLEVEWANFTLTSSLVNGYNNVTRHLYFDFGDDSPGWWTNYQVWYVAYGAPDNVPLPEIFYQADAVKDWEVLSVWACNHEGGPLNIKGTISEFVPHTNSPAQAFADMYNAESSNGCTARARSGMIFSTEMYHTGQF